jgi:hypothetical protein
MLGWMSHISPTLEGFRAAFRRPVLTLSEVTWRWAVGATACALFVFSLFEYFDTLPVTGRERLMLRSGHPVLISRAIAHILQGSFNRAVVAALLGMMALTGLWIVAASLGRSATVRALLDYFASRREVVRSVSTGRDGVRRSDQFSIQSQSFWSLLGINFLRATVTLAAILCLVGAMLVAGLLSPEGNPQPGFAFLVFTTLAGIVGLLWWMLNWLLSLAAIFSVRDGEDTLGALSAAVGVCRDRAGAVFAVSAWTELAHIAVFIVAGAVAWLPLFLLRIAPVRVVAAGVLLVALAYFAVVDWLYIARLAGYVCIAEMPQDSVAPSFQPAPPPASIDRDEPILSDLPGVVPEM